MMMATTIRSFGRRDNDDRYTAEAEAATRSRHPTAHRITSTSVARPVRPIINSIPRRVLFRLIHDVLRLRLDETALRRCLRKRRKATATRCFSEVDWVKVLRPTRHKIGSFRRRSSKPIYWLGMEKLNVTQKHAFTNQKKCTAT